MWLISSDRVMTFLTSNVFKRANRENEEHVSTAALQARERLKPNRCKPCLCTRLRRYTAIEKEQAEKKIENELDILTYFRKLMKLEAAFKVIFTKPERLLLSNQACFTVEDSERRSSSSEDQVEIDPEDQSKYFQLLVQGLNWKKQSSIERARLTNLDERKRVDNQAERNRGGSQIEKEEEEYQAQKAREEDQVKEVGQKNRVKRVKSKKFKIDDFNRIQLDAHNEYRASHDVLPVEWCPDLAKQA